MPRYSQEFELQFPVAGLWKRGPYAKQGPFYTPACLNVWPDDSLEGRERGGLRPCLGKHFAQQVSGSANPIRAIGDVRYLSSGSFRNLVYAVAGGALWTDRASVGTLASAGVTPTFATDRRVTSTDLLQKVYFADTSANRGSGTDGAISTASFTSSSVGNFASAGVVAATDVVEITSHTAINEVQSVTIDASGGTFKLLYRGIPTSSLAYDASTSTVQTALRLIAGLESVTVGGSASNYTVTFAGDLAGTDVDLLSYSNSLTGGASTVTIAETTKGRSATDGAGVYRITSVVTTTITLTDTPGFNLSGATFRILRGPKVYNPADNTLVIYKSTAGLGDVPVGCSIIARWNGRIVMAGDPNNPHVWYMSRQGDPLDWDYSQEDQGTAVAATAADAGVVGEPITGLIPHANGCCIVGCQNSLHVLRGDPAAGGRQVQLSDKIGLFSATSFAHTPEMHLFFLSLDGVYFMAEGCGNRPVQVSRKVLPEDLLNLDPATNNVEMAYSLRYRGIIFTISKSDASATTHYLLKVSSRVTADEVTANAAFFPMTFHSDFDPTAMCVRRSHPSNTCTVLLGGRDGYVRSFSHSLAQDDGNNVTSYVAYGPFAPADGQFDDGLLTAIQAALDGSSGDVDWTVYTGDTAEEAAAMSTTHSAGEFNTPGWTHRAYPRARGRFLVVKLSNGESNARWAIDQLLGWRDWGGTV